MKIVKMLGKILKWYAVLDVLFWAWIGLSRFCQRCEEEPDLGVVEGIVAAYNDSCFWWSKFLKN